MSVPISNVVRRVVFAPSGTGPYAFTFEILAATDIQVYKGDTLLTLTTDYTVTINTNGTGSVTLVSTAGTDNITIVGARTIQRTTDFVTGGDLFANSLNTELDSLTIFTQQNSEANVRSIKAPVTDPTTINMTLPTKTARAGKYLSFNSSTGNPEVVNTVVDVTAVAANSTNINTVAGQISPVNNISTVAGAAANIATVAGIAANVTTVAGISGNVTTVAGISADVTAVAGDATDIGAVAAISADVQALGPIAADITAVAAVDSDVTAVAAIDSDVTAVAGVAANVTTVAGIAANVTTVAGISADVTTVATNVTDITNFSDVYLGPKSSDPSVRNDSSALQAGDLYFDTVADVMKVYTGSAWVAAYVSGTGFVDLSSAQTITGVKTFDNGLATDTISEETAAAGVTVDGVLLKDNQVSTDQINEKTSAAGVTIDGVLLKDTTVTANTIKASGTSSSQGEVQLFEDTDNGTNYVAIKAPASIASNVTWTLPNADGTANQVLKTDGSGALGWATPGGGKILQVLTAVDTSTRSTTSQTFVTGSAASVTITPASASNKIYVTCSGNATCDDGNDGWAVTIYRGSTNLGNANSGLASGNSVPGITATFFPFCMTILDSPNTTSATTYELRFRNINADSDAFNTTTIGSYISGTGDPIPTHITVFEVAA